MWGWFDSIINWFSSIWESITSIPSKIGEVIENIFVPDVAEIENQFEATFDNVYSQLGVEFNTFDRLLDREVAPKDVTGEYNLSGVGKLQLKFMNSDFLIQGVAMMRPYIRGFLVLLLVLFTWRQLLSFIGQDPSIAHNSYSDYKEWKEGDNK